MSSSKRLARLNEELVFKLEWYQLERLSFSVGYKYIVALATSGREMIFGPIVTVGVLINVHHSVPPKDIFLVDKDFIPTGLTYNYVVRSCKDINKVQNVDLTIRESKKEVLTKIVTQESLPARYIVFTDWISPNFSVDHLAIVRGDRCVYSLTLSFRLADQIRKKLILDLIHKHPKWACYGLDQSFGSATSKHKKAISEFGYTSHHRYYLKKEKSNA